MSVKRYKGAKAKADKLFSEIIRTIGYCENCGKTEWLQCAHINSRRFNATRVDIRNAFCLCASCHRFYTDYPREFSHFITDTWAADYYDQMFHDSRTGTKVNWDDELDNLKAIKAELDSGKTLKEIRYERNNAGWN